MQLDGDVSWLLKYFVTQWCLGHRLFSVDFTTDREEGFYFFKDGDLPGELIVRVQLDTVKLADFFKLEDDLDKLSFIALPTNPSTV